MKSFRSLTALGLSFFLLLPFFGCGKETPSSSNELVFWHWWTDRQHIFEKLAQQYEKETGTRVRFQVAAPIGSEYNNKLQAAAQGNTLPDIIGIAAGGEFLARYINAGKIEELTEHMNNGWRDQFYEHAVEAFTYREGNQFGVKPNSTWAAPVSAMSIQIFYNKDHFQKAGLDPDHPPKTWEAFLEAGKTLRQNGIVPMSIGLGDLWMIGAFLEPYSWCYAGEKNIKATFLGERSYNSPEWKKTLQLFADLKDNNILIRGAVTLPNKESEQLFASGRVAMTMNGSWGVSVYKGMNPQLNYGVMRFPKPKDCAYPLYVRGGAGSAAAVAAQSQNKEEAIRFLQWLTAKEQQTVYANEGLDLPANRNCADSIIPQLKNFATAMNELIPDIQLSEKYEVQETLWKGVQSIFIGEQTPEDVLRKAKKAKERSLKGI